MKNKMRAIVTALVMTLIGASIGTTVGVASVAAPPAIVDVVDDVSEASAAAGCNQGNGVHSNYFYEMGVWMPHTFTITCTSQVPSGGWKARYHVFCQYTDKWTGWVQFLNQSKSASCGLGEGGIVSVSPQFVQV